VFYKKINNLEDKNMVLAISCFDGFHKGNIKLLENLAIKAKDTNTKALAIVLPRDKKDFLTTNKELEHYFADIKDIDFIFLDEDQNIETVENELLKANFVCKDILVEKELQDISKVEKFCIENNIKLTIEDLIDFENEPITTLRIKKELTAGNFEKAILMLGHPYLMYGHVEHGKQLGRTVGMPTANLGVTKGKLFPEDGVYATTLHVKGKSNLGMTNIGKRPSVDAFTYKTIETFIIDFAQDIYDEEVWLYVDKFVRPVIKFDCLEKVKIQVNKDIEKVRQHYSKK
jgi:riboflavin kinase/FMN adenylyltransferase